VVSALATTYSDGSCWSNVEWTWIKLKPERKMTGAPEGKMTGARK